MSLESFREYCSKAKFYYFGSLADFDNRVDWNGKSVKNISFDRGIIDEGENNTPTRWSAYGVTDDNLTKR